MREIKFKAWNKTDNEWYMNGDQFDLAYSARYGDFFFNNDHPSNMRDVELEWVQFTGLKDKNGKKIYEGDILDSKYKWEVIYFADGFVGMHRSPSNTLPLHALIQKRITAGAPVEIIGNIHENPELLQESE